MAEKRHIQHLRSSVVEQNGQPKLPLASNLQYGELAINYHKGTETVSFKNDEDEIVLFHDEVEISSGQPKVNTEIWIDTSDKSVTEVYTKEQIDSQVSGINNDIASVKSKDTEQDSRIQALEGKDVAYETRLDAVESLASNNIIISDTTPSSNNTELFVDTSNDGGLYEVYTKVQVDGFIAELQRQIDELKEQINELRG